MPQFPDLPARIAIAFCTLALLCGACRSEWKPPATDTIPAQRTPPDIAKLGSHAIIVAPHDALGSHLVAPPTAHIRDALIRELRKAGFDARTVGTSAGGPGVRFVLRVKYAFDVADGSVVTQADWSLYDNKVDRVTYLLLTRGTSALKPPIKGAHATISLTVRKLIGDGPFIERVVRKRPDGTKPVAVVGQALELPRCTSTDALALPAQMAKPMAAVVAVEVGGRLGAGVVVSPDGHIFTAAHVTGLQGRVKVTFKSGRSFRAERVNIQPKADVAMVKIPGTGHACVPGVASRPAPGTNVFGVGMPAGLRFSVSKGVVSGYRELFGMKLLQTDTSLNPGNSGGPLLTPSGKLAGIVSWKLGQSEGLSFAVPFDAAVQALKINWVKR